MTKSRKAKVNLIQHRTFTEISASSSGNVVRYELLAGKDIFPEKDLLGKVATMEGFEYSSLGRKLIAQIDISNIQYENLDDTYEFDKINKNEKTNT